MQSNMKSIVPEILLFCFYYLSAIQTLVAPLSAAIDVECHSCLGSCKTLADGKLDPETCDCSGGNATGISNGTDTCQGSHCFAKVEFFPDEMIAIVQKGCLEGLAKGLDGCHYAGQLESVHCYCQGHLCNTKEKLDFFAPKPLPTLECCECSKPGGDECSEDNCTRTCTGNYCLIDFDGIEQGCGMGLPRLQNFLRIPSYFEALQGEMTCARYEAAPSTSVHGCICTKPTGMCNQVNKSRQYQLDQVISRRVSDQNYCYSLHQRSEEPFDKAVFRAAETCEGHYCFVSLTTSELVIEVRNNSDLAANVLNLSDGVSYKGVAKPRYEILAGCLKVDDDKKVSPGCTWEYLDKENPLSRHCVCDSHLCNYFDILERNDRTNETHDNFAESPNSPATNVLHDETEPRSTSSSISVCYVLSFMSIIVLLASTNFY